MSFAAPAQVRALVVPTGLITVGQFHQHFERLQQASVVALIDVHLPNPDENLSEDSSKPSNEGSGAFETFDPRANPTGSITYNFETSPLTDPHQALIDLEPWRQQFLAVGIAHANEKLTTDDLSTSLAQLRRVYPKSIYHVILVFDAEENSAEDIPGIFFISKTKITAVETVLSTISGQFLARMSTFWTARQYSSFQSPAAMFASRGGQAKTNRPRTNHQHHHPVSHQHAASGVILGRSGSISMTTTERAKSRQDGRTRKFLGNLYLLTGRISDALIELGLAATILRDYEDHLWMGSTLSDIGLCLVIQKFQRSQSPIPQAAVASAWAVASRYLKKNRRNPATVHIGHSASSPAHSHRSSSVASLTDNNNDQMQYQHQNTNQLQQQQHQQQSTTPSSNSSPRSSVTLTRIVSLHKSRPFTDQTPIEEMLEYLITASLDEYALGHGEEVVPYTVYYEQVVRYAEFLICLRSAHGWTDFALEAALGYRQLEPSVANPNEYPTILDLENWISRVYSLSLNQLEPDVQALILGAVARLYARAGLKRKWAFTCSRVVNLLASSRATVHTDLGQVAEVLQVYTTWPKLEAEMLWKLIPLGQRIQNARLQTDAASQLLTMACRDRATMVDKEQLTLYQVIRSLSDVTQATFWDRDLVMSAKVKSHRLTSVRTKNRANTGPGADALIYNPFDEVETKEIGSIEAGVPTTAKIALRNPLAIDIQLFELALVDKDGIHVSEKVETITLPANVEHFKVDTTIVPPTDKPTLEITGCYVQVSGCASEIHTLPTTVTVPIIPARPVLVLQELSLQKGWTMLLEGERKDFTITLWNSSKILNEILHFGFNDSTVDTLRPLISRQDISRAEYHEYEYFLHKRRAIDFRDGSEVAAHFAPQESRIFKFSITGKRGVNAAAVLVDYGISEDTLRRLKIPLQVTIYPSITIERASVLPSTKPETVLLVLDLRNFWRESLICKVWADKSTPQEQRIDISSSKRFVIEVPWEPTALEDLLKPIPSLTKRQHTVDTKTPPEHLQLFWLREKLLNRLHGEWRTENGRKGYIELRMIQITKRMAATLRSSPVDISAELTKSPQSVDDPARMTVTVTNKSPKPIQGMLRLIPNKPAQRYMLALGAVQQLVRLSSGEKTEVSFEMVFLNNGPFELTSALDPIDTPGLVEPVLQSSKNFVYI